MIFFLTFKCCFGKEKGSRALLHHAWSKQKMNSISLSSSATKREGAIFIPSHNEKSYRAKDYERWEWNWGKESFTIHRWSCDTCAAYCNNAAENVEW